MNMNVRQLPWRTIRRAYYEWRNLLFSNGVPNNVDGLVLDMTIEELRVFLRKRHFDQQQFSYHKYGEDLNMYRAEYNPDAKHDEFQLHVRAFELPDGSIWVIAHYEYDPTERPKLHLSGKHLDWDKGLEMTKQILDDEGVSYNVRSKSSVTTVRS